MVRAVRSSLLVLGLALGATAAARAQDGPTGPADDAAARTARARETIATRRVTVRLERQSLDEGLDALRALTDLDVVVSPDARDAAKDRPVSLRLRRVTVRSCLELLLGQVDRDLRWTVRRGVVHVETRAEARARTPRRLVLHDVSDIAGGRPTFRAPRLGLDGLVWDAAEDCDCWCGTCCRH